MAEKKVNCLGLDKFQTAIIKRNYQTMKPWLNKWNKAREKYEEALQKIKEKYEEELKVLSFQIDAYDKITSKYTKDSCGYELTTEQASNFIDNPNLFEEYKQEYPLQIEVDFQEEQSENNGNIEQVTTEE